MLPGQADRETEAAMDRLARTWDGFLRLSKGERREFLAMLRD